ncbi:MAG: hypothetical protein ACE5OZ_24180 [Candidatus Heimdallarchaeota archaeon]
MFDLEDYKKYWSKAELDEIISEIKAEFPNDELMFELHLMRALKIKEKPSSHS